MPNLLRSIFTSVRSGHPGPQGSRFSVTDLRSGKQIYPDDPGPDPQVLPLIGTGKFSPPGDAFLLALVPGMAGTVTREGRSVSLADIALLGLTSEAPRYPWQAGQAAPVYLPVRPGTVVEVEMTGTALQNGAGYRLEWLPLPGVEPLKPVRYPKLPVRPRVRMTSREIRFADIRTLPDNTLTFWNALGIAVIASVFLFNFLDHMRAHYLPRPEANQWKPSDRVVRLYTNAPKPPVPKTVETPKAVPETAVSAAPASSAPSAATDLKVQGKPRPGLLKVIAENDSQLRGQIARLDKAMDNVFHALPPVTQTGPGDTDAPQLGKWDKAGDLKDSDIARLMPGGPRSDVPRTAAETITTPVVSKELEGESGRTMASIKATIQRYLPMLKSRHKRLLRTAPAAQGRLEAAFTIRADGSVVSPRIVSSAFGRYPEFEQEILDILIKIRFDSVDKGDVKVSFPFLFSVND